MQEKQMEKLKYLKEKVIILRSDYSKFALMDNDVFF